MPQYVPTGIQQLLQLAQVDEQFRRELVARRDEAAEAAGVALSASERHILRAIGAEQLTEMAAKLPATASSRRESLATAAATAVLLLSGVALGGTLSGCDRSQETAREGPIPERPAHRNMDTEGGISPDWSPPETDKPGAPGPTATASATSNPEPTATGSATSKPAPPVAPAPPTVPTRQNPTRGIRSDMPL